MRPVTRWLIIAAIPVAAVLGAVGGLQLLPAFVAPPPATAATASTPAATTTPTTPTTPAATTTPTTPATPTTTTPAAAVADTTPPKVETVPTPRTTGGAPTICDRLKSLPADHPWVAFALDSAAKTGKAGELYLDKGQWCALAYVMTGDAKWVAPAMAKILPVIGKDPPNANYIRENFIDLALWYGWLKPALTLEQDAAYRKGLNRWCEWCLAVGTKPYAGGFRLADTDQTVGQYFGLRICDQMLGTDWSAKADALGAREAIRHYCDWSKGGEWVESESYNLGTLKLLLCGAYGAGIEQFPEVATLEPQLAAMQLANLTPDGKDAYKWGDEENAGDVLLHKRVPLLAILAGLTGDPAVYAALDALTKGRAVKQYLSLGWRALYFYRPSRPRPPAASGFFYASDGNGHFRYKRDGALFGCHFPRRLSIDHEVAYFGDFRLYLDGEWVISHPLGYAGGMVEGGAANACLLSGLSSMFERGPDSWEETPGSCRVTGTTSGSYYGKPYYDPPPAFASWTRTLTYTFPGKVVALDAFKGGPPQRVERYRKADADRIKNAPATWQQVWHCPVKPTETKTGFEWKTPGGKTVTLTSPVGVKAVVTAEKNRLPDGGYAKATELAGYQIRFLSDEPKCEMVTTIKVN